MLRGATEQFVANVKETSGKQQRDLDNQEGENDEDDDNNDDEEDNEVMIDDASQPHQPSVDVDLHVNVKRLLFTFLYSCHF